MLTVNEIFYSIQGESTRAGRPCVFVRLTACDLRCSWCDTPYAFHEGRKMSIDEVVAAVDRYECELVDFEFVGEAIARNELAWRTVAILLSPVYCVLAPKALS